MQQPIEVVVDESQQVVERVAAIDVAKATGMVCTRVPHETVAGRRVTKVWEVKATTKGLLELADHLVGNRIERVVLESTSDYWRSFFYILEGAGLEVWLVNARQVKNVPGRPKTDKLDAVWLAKLAERSMVSASFVPDEAMRHVRDLARARFDLVGDRTRVKQRVEKLLEDALIKIGSILSDIHGVSGRAMIEALIVGERDPEVLAGLAKGRARVRVSALAEAADGRFSDHHARLARLLLDQADDLARRIDEVTALLDQAIAAVPASPTVDAATGEIVTAPAGLDSATERISALPGAGPDTARAVIGEIGLDMDVFGTAARLASWAKASPRSVQSGRKTGKATTGKGNPYLKGALHQMAMSASKTDTFLGARYRRLAKRMPKAKALAALERSILTIIFHLLADPTATYHDLGADYYDRRLDKTRRTRNLVHQLQSLGHTVTLTPAAA
ncbi:MAG: IS110 family transposase [Actinomycetota bacterium]|nr:IS110 family transposase [Actinomycetota bacterium]